MPPIGPDGGTGPRGSMAKISGVPYVTSSFCFRLGPTPVAIVSFGPTRELSFGNPTVRPRVAVDRGSERQKKRRRETNRIAVVLVAMAERKKHKSWEMDRRTASVVSPKSNAGRVSSSSYYAGIRLGGIEEHNVESSSCWLFCIVDSKARVDFAAIRPCD